MKDFSFFSEDTYIYLPSLNNPKVILAISNSAVAKNAFKLYNPFSVKAKILKRGSEFFMFFFNRWIPKVGNIKVHQQSNFTNWLEQKLDLEFNVSIYNATDKNKVVLQLQIEKKIYGYLKFPLTNKGISHIKNEKLAIEILSKEKIVKPYKFQGNYNDFPFFILEEVQGSIGELSDSIIEKILLPLKKTSKFQLKEHPRIISICKELEGENLQKYQAKIEAVINRSKAYFYEVYEHGDFTPWNIIQTEKEPVLFDFEFFVEVGIEYFDLIKYHFQAGRILKKKNHIQLTDYIFNKMNYTEIKELLILFLIKEIVRVQREGESSEFQNRMLNYICE